MMESLTDEIYGEAMKVFVNKFFLMKLGFVKILLKVMSNYWPLVPKFFVLSVFKICVFRKALFLKWNLLFLGYPTS